MRSRGWLSTVALSTVVALGGFGLWTQQASRERLQQHVRVHHAPQPTAADPAPLDTDTQRAIARGRHLVEVRYICVQCHAQDCGGGVMVDEPVMAVLHGPNLTRGLGSAVAHYTWADWDRAVRHGVRRDGTPLLMPSQDFAAVTDQELRDIVVYLGSLPPVDRASKRAKLGPIGSALLATGVLRLAAEQIHDHEAPHRATVPEHASAELGATMSGVCRGCHGERLSGGKIVLGDPLWPVAANLTPHAQGIAGWRYADFERAMRRGLRPDGTRMRAPMTLMTPYTAKLRDTELQALWLYLSSLPPARTGA
ncbi:MAG: c-type cytochrome [Polyangiales bacterium]